MKLLLMLVWLAGMPGFAQGGGGGTQDAIFQAVFERQSWVVVDSDDTRIAKVGAPHAGPRDGPGVILANSVAKVTDAEDVSSKPARISRPPLRAGPLPRTRWQHRPNNQLWTRAALSALRGHGVPLVEMEPADIAQWCPAYASNPPAKRRAFWVGFLSALAKYESTYRAGAVGGGGKWYGLLQILPGTARGYGCAARTGNALKSGAANLSCAIRIMAVTVPRDGVIYGRGGRGVAADWGPMRSSRKRGEMAAWLRGQTYCKLLNETRPRSRP